MAQAALPARSPKSWTTKSGNIAMGQVSINHRRNASYVPPPVTRSALRRGATQIRAHPIG